MTREELARISADRINMLKNERDVSFREIERDTGLAHTSICGFSRGSHVPNGYGLYVLSEYFKVSADFILGLTDVRGRSV